MDEPESGYDRRAEVEALRAGHDGAWAPSRFLDRIARSMDLEVRVVNEFEPGDECRPRQRNA